MYYYLYVCLADLFISFLVAHCSSASWNQIDENCIWDKWIDVIRRKMWEHAICICILPKFFFGWQTLSLSLSYWHAFHSLCIFFFEETTLTLMLPFRHQHRHRSFHIQLHIHHQRAARTKKMIGNNNNQETWTRERTPQKHFVQSPIYDTIYGISRNDADSHKKKNHKHTQMGCEWFSSILICLPFTFILFTMNGGKKKELKWSEFIDCRATIEIFIRMANHYSLLLYFDKYNNGYEVGLSTIQKKNKNKKTNSKRHMPHT